MRAFNFIQQNGLNFNGAGATPVSFDGVSGVLSESAAAVAAAGTNQATATPVVKQMNLVNSGTGGVCLPASSAGIGITVVNGTAAPVVVYPAVADGNTATVNGNASTVGVVLAPGDVVDFECFVAGAWYGESGVGVAGSIPLELATGTVAAAGSTQAAATPLTYPLTRVNSATAGTAQGIALPQSVGGMRFAVVNNTAVPITVYGVNSGTDTINGIAGSTGITQLPYSFVEYVSPVTGVWYALNLGSGFSTSSSIPTGSFVDSVTAIGTSKTTAYQMTTAMVRVTTNAGTPAGVTLPASFPGYQGLAIMNASANALVIYGAGSDTINHAGTTAATYSLAAGYTAQLFCTVAGVWHISVSA